AAYGAWRAGVETLLLADALPATAASLVSAGLIGMTACAVRAEGIAHIEPDGSPSVPLCTEAPLPEGNVLVSLLTSGSTGEPKCIPKRLDQLFLEVEGIDSALAADGLGAEALIQAGRQIPVYATVTHQHIYGLLWRALWPLLGGGLLTDERLHFPEKLAAALASETAAQGFMVVSSPAHLRRFDEPGLFAGSQGRALAVISSAGPLDDTGAANSEAAFGRFPFEILGSTETGGIARRTRHRTASGLVTPAWLPMPGVEIGIIPEDDDGSADADRRILSHAALLAEGVSFPVRGTLALRTRQLESSDFEAGSDLIELGADGSFALAGRADRIVKVEGKRISLNRIEKRLLTSDLVTNVRALLFTGRRDEIAVAAELSDAGRARLFSEGKRSVAAALRHLLDGEIEPVALPRRWRFLDKFPVNAQGKTTAAALRAVFDPRLPEWHRITGSDIPAGAAVLRTTLNPQLAWFNGHFPELPILPGVAQITMATSLARSEFSIDAPLGAVRQLKF
ncbi:MAG: AMP-binding protein, partial [Sutterella sp.]